LAGKLKPQASMVEAQYVINEDGGSLYWYTILPRNLFDESTTYTHPYVYFDKTDNNFIDITVKNNFTIWDCPADDADAHHSGLIIYKWENSTWIDVTSLYPYVGNSNWVNTTTWYKIYENIPSGRYKFSSPSDHLSSEWFLENKTIYKYLFYNMVTKEVLSFNTITNAYEVQGMMENINNLTDVDKTNLNVWNGSNKLTSLTQLPTDKKILDFFRMTNQKLKILLTKH
jgi:hypothetical protein